MNPKGGNFLEGDIVIIGSEQKKTVGIYGHKSLIKIFKIIPEPVLLQYFNCTKFMHEVGPHTIVPDFNAVFTTDVEPGEADKTTFEMRDVNDVIVEMEKAGLIKFSHVKE